MKKLKNLEESDFLKLFFAFFSLAFLVGALCMPDRARMFSGMTQILSQPCKIPTNYFSVGGFSATLFNMSVVSFMCLGLYVVLGAKMDATASMAVILTVGFGSWGINIQNIWPTIWGAMLYCAVRKKPLKNYVSAMLFTTGIAPLVTDILIRHPVNGLVGYSWARLGMAILIGLVSGFFVPAGLTHSPNVHKGYNLYNAALPVGMGAFILQAILFQTLGVDLPSAPDAETLKVTSKVIANSYWLILCGTCIVVAALMGCTPKKYWALLNSSERVASVSHTLGNDVFLMNFGVFGLFILAYYNLVGAKFSGPTFGVMFCMLSTCNSGSHPKNAWPMLLGYIVAVPVCRWICAYMGTSFTYHINAQAILIGACYTNGMTPIVDRYGAGVGFVAGVLHFLLVTSVPMLHGGFCLYNGGLTAAFICLILMPTVEELIPTKEQRRMKRLEKKR